VTIAQETAGAGTLVVPALCFRGVSFRYREDRPLALDGLDFEVGRGELLAVVGGNGSGKSTLARLCNGLLEPASGEVLVDGRNTADPDSLWPIRSNVGLLFQDPEDQIVGASVEDDVAFGLENLGVPRDEMLRRVADVLEVVGLAGEEATEPHLLSGGQKQRLALAGVLVLEPTLLVLDEPTSMLDAAGREEVLDFVRALTRRGVGVVMITQHMGEALEADRLLALDGGRRAYLGDARSFFSLGAFKELPLGTPPAMALAREVLGEVPLADLPVTEDELVGVLGGARSGEGAPPGRPQSPGGPDIGSTGTPAVSPGVSQGVPPDVTQGLPQGVSPGGGRAAGPQADRPVVTLSAVSVVYNRGTSLERRGLEAVDLTIEEGSVTAVLGATASGKSTLLQTLAGLLKPTAGVREWSGRARPLAGEVGMVFQRPEAQLFKGTVWEDVAVAPRLRGVEGAALEARVKWAMSAVGLDVQEFGPRAPHGLSMGERRRVALAGIMSLDPALLVLDEPGAGLDPLARRHLIELLAAWAAGEAAGARSKAGVRGDGTSRGRADGASGPRTLLLSTHDMDEAAEVADRVVILRHGRIEATGPAARVLSDFDTLERAGLRPPLAAQVARRLGARSVDAVVEGKGLSQWLGNRDPS